jgi:TetR/AcrR family transcriptional repressor of nem operon
MTAKTKGEMTRAKILEAARSLIHVKGFGNTSINDIIEASGVKKGNLYFHFPSKEALGVAIIEQARDEFTTFLSDIINDKKRSPLNKLAHMLDVILEEHEETNLVGGCIFGNIALESCDCNPVFSNMIDSLFQKWTEVIAKLLDEAQQQGELKPEPPPTLLAKHIIALIEGSIMLGRVSKKTDDLRDCLKSLRILMGMQI